MLCMAKEGDALAWYRSKLTEELFRGGEVGLFRTFENHLKQYNRLPPISTLYERFPDLKEIPIDDAPKAYMDSLEQRYKYDLINNANVESQKILAEDKTAVEEAFAIMVKAQEKIQERNLTTRLIEFGKDAGQLLLSEYHEPDFTKSVMRFHWGYLDYKAKGAQAGDMISVVGRPQAGKSWVLMYNAYSNYKIDGKSSLIVSMEMNHLAIAQRLSTLNSKTNLTQLKTKAYSSSTYQKFRASLNQLEGLNGAKMYIVDGNLAADIEDIYMLAQQLQVDGVYVDGTYLCRTKNTRLSRYDRVTEVAESCKRFTSQLEIPSFTSWQFNRDASKGKTKKEQQEAATLDNIGMTDAVGQLSSVVLGLTQEKSVETLNHRQIDVLKGRDGEVGRFRINWDFTNMDLSEASEEQRGALQFI